jgi:hypothetical protein
METLKLCCQQSGGGNLGDDPNSNWNRWKRICYHLSMTYFIKELLLEEGTLSVSGNPTMSNISAIFAAIQKKLRVEVRTEVVAV